VPVYTPLPDSAQFLMDTYGITAEQAGDGGPDVVWLLRENKGEARPYSACDRLPFGADVFPGHKANDTVLWVESRGAVISGDTLVDFGKGFEINERWLRPGVTREEIAEGLRPLLALPVEHVLATHGGPGDRAALERALALPRRRPPSARGRPPRRCSRRDRGRTRRSSSRCTRDAHRAVRCLSRRGPLPHRASA
jgi:glyoxylase-like metal-dependent hydrolase (beta-lactamase superfamily II)